MKLTDDNFKTLLENNENVLIKFGAEQCGPCRTLDPILKEIEQNYKDDNIIFAYCDVDENSVLSSTYQVRNIPLVLFIKNNEIKEKSVGMLTKTQLEEKINNLIQ